MLEIKKDRLIEINKQLKKVYKTKNCFMIAPLKKEKRDLEKEINKMEG